MMKKRWRGLAVFIAGVMLAGCGAAGGNGEKKTGDDDVLHVWSTSDDMNKFVEGFEKKNPDIDVEVTVVPNEDYLAKLTPTLSSGKDAPDIFTAESDYVEYLVEMDFWDDLSKQPYAFDNAEKGLWDYVVDVGTDSDGTVKALSWQASPGGLIYRTDLAEKYLGVKTPDEMSEKISSMDKMMETAKELKENGVAMFASWEDLLNMEFSNREEAWVSDDKLNLSENMEAFMDTAKTIHEQGYALNTSPWDGEWVAAVNQDEAFGYVLPTWGYQYVIKANAKETSGNWGLAETPVSYVKGGTWMGVYKDSTKKEAAWKFMEYVTCDEETQTEYAKANGEYMSLKAVDEALAKEPGDDVLGGQNLYEFYNRQMGKELKTLMSPYDGTINNAFLASVKLYADGTMKKEEAIRQFRDEVKAAYPELAVE